MTWENIRVCPVTLNTSGFINTYSVMSWANMMHVAGQLQIPMRKFLCYDNHPISYARNMAVKEFLADKQNTHLLFIDSDMVVPEQAIPIMLNHNKLVVSGWYLSRTGNQKPMVFNQTKYGWASLTVEDIINNPKRLMQVDAVGAGLLLISRQVFEILNTDEPFMESTGMQHGNLFTGEDLYFCNKLHEHEIPLYIDNLLFCKHHGWTLF